MLNKLEEFLESRRGKPGPKTDLHKEMLTMDFICDADARRTLTFERAKELERKFSFWL